MTSERGREFVQLAKAAASATPPSTIVESIMPASKVGRRLFSPPQKRDNMLIKTYPSCRGSAGLDSGFSIWRCTRLGFHIACCRNRGVGERTTVSTFDSKNLCQIPIIELRTQLHKRNDFAEVSKNLGRSKNNFVSTIKNNYTIIKIIMPNVAFTYLCSK